MPYVSDSNLDENNQNNGSGASQSQAGQVSGQPNTVSGSTETQSQTQTKDSANSATEAPKAPSLAGSSEFASSPQGEGMSNAPQASYNSSAPTSGNSWTNLQSYLDANNSGQFGQQFSGKISSKVDDANQAVSSAATNFQNAVSASTIQDNADLDQAVQSDPVHMADADKAAFKSQLKASYNGPQSAGSDASFQAAEGKAKNAYTEAQQAQTAPGQQTLLKQYYNTPTYSYGEQGLDSALLSADPSAQAALHSLAQQASGIPVATQAATNAANAQAAQAQATTQAAREAANAALYGKGGSATNIKGGGVQNALDAVKASVSSNQTAADAAYQHFLGALRNPQAYQANNGAIHGNNTYLSAQDFQTLGLGNQNYYLGHLDPTQYLSQAAAPTAENSVTSDEAARLNALASLGDVPESWLNTSQAGTFNANPTFRSSEFAQASQQAQNDLKTDPTLSSLLNKYLAANDRGDRAGALAAGQLLSEAQSAAGQHNWLRVDGTQASPDNPTVTGGLKLENPLSKYSRMR